MIADVRQSWQVQPASWIEAFDGLRGLAILLVFVHHLVEFTPQAGMHPWVHGRVGVDLFFVISGFLITRILLGCKGRPDYFVRFWRRRALRILPLTVVFVIVTSILASAWRADGMIFKPWWILTFFQNWWIGSNVEATPYFVSISWSLAVEEQFYLGWPILVALCSRQRLMQIIGLILVTSPFIRLLVSQVWGYDEVYFWTLSRLDGLGFGVLAYYAYEYSPRLRTLMTWAAKPLSLGLVIGMLVGFSEANDWFQAFGYTYIAVTFACLVVATVSGGWHWFERVCRFKALAYVGRVSFSLYLWHQLLNMLVYTVVVGTLGSLATSWQALVAYLLVASALSFGMAHLSYKCIEEPFLRLKGT